MLALQYIRENKEALLAGLKKRNFQSTEKIDEIISLDQKRRTQQAELDQHLAKANSLAKEIGVLFKSGETAKANEIKEQTASLKELTKKLQEELQLTTTRLNELRTQIPNVPHELVPTGNSEQDNEEVFHSGSIPELGENPLPHWELAQKYDLIDFELGNKITGAGFPVFKGKGARLQRALINYFLDKNTAAGYKEVQVPHLVNEASGFGTGQLPDKEGQMYHIQNDDLYLIPTAEVPLTNIVRDEIIAVENLPIKMVAHSPCFRSEAGSYGRDTRGMIRQHQFDKIEIMQVVHPEESYEVLDEMVSHAENILKMLKLPYRLVSLCTGDIGFGAAKTYDLEVWIPSQNTYREVSSVSNFEAFQARRLKARFRKPHGEKELVHTLNGSGLAVGRTLVALLENFQQADGSVEIPEVLHKYMGGITNLSI